MYKFLVLICVLFSACATSNIASTSNTGEVPVADQLPDLQEAWRVVPSEVKARWVPLVEQAAGNVGDQGSFEQLRVSARDAAFSKGCDRTKVAEVSFMLHDSQMGKIFTLRDFTYRFITTAIKSGRSWREVEGGTYQMAVAASKESVAFWRSVDLCEVVASW